MEGYGACYRKIVRDINTLLACVKKAAEFARIGPAETHAVETRPGRDGGDADASPAARPGGIGAPITGRQNGGRTSGGGRVVGCPLPSCVGCLGDRRPWTSSDTSQPGENQELIGRGRGIDGEVCHPQPSDRRRPPAQAADHERRHRRLTGELVAQGSPWRADAPAAATTRQERRLPLAASEACSSMRMSVNQANPKRQSSRPQRNTDLATRERRRELSPPPGQNGPDAEPGNAAVLLAESGAGRPRWLFHPGLRLSTDEPVTPVSRLGPRPISCPWLPLDGTADRWRLPGRRYAGRHNGSDGLDQLPARADGRRSGAALIQATTVFEPAIRVIAEEVGRTNGAISPRYRLVFVVQIRKRKRARLREALHGLEGILGVGISIVGANRGKPDPLCHERSRIGDEAVDHRLHVRTMIADEDDHRAALSGNVFERINPPVCARKPKVDGKRVLRERRRGCCHGGHLLGLGVRRNMHPSPLHPDPNLKRGVTADEVLLNR